MIDYVKEANVRSIWPILGYDFNVDQRKQLIEEFNESLNEIKAKYRKEFIWLK